MTAPASEETRPLHVGLLTQLCHGSMMAVALSINLLPVYLTILSTTYGGSAGLSKEHLGRLGACGFTGLVLGIIVSGPLCDRWGAKLFVQIGNASIALGLLGAALAPGYDSLCAALAIAGFGAGVFDMVLSPIVAVLHPERRTSAMNWLHSFYCVGAILTVLEGTACQGLGIGWRGACLILTPLPIALFIAFMPLRLPKLVSDKGRTRLRTLVRQPWLLVSLAAIFLGGSTELGMAQWLPTYAKANLRFPDWMGNTSLLLFSVTMAAGRMILGAIGHRISPYLALAVGAGSSAALFVAATAIPEPHLALAACIAVGITGSALWPTILAVAADRFPDGGATMFAALATFGNSGGIFMPWVVGAVADYEGLRVGLAVSIIAPLGLLPLIAIMRRGAHAPHVAARAA